MDPDARCITLRRFRRNASERERKAFGKALIDALNELKIPPGGEFVVAELVVQPSLEESPDAA